ncbi:MAG: polyprenyl synthetase family protein [Rhizobiales bacterium]|nr:polyprenyl synthetase family protein [Hyphomicrobiales bacterium]
MENTFHDRLAEAAHATDAALDRLLAPAALAGEIARPDRLREAMRYAALSPGKRLRPFVLIESARLFGAAGPAVAEAAAALECVHAYSLVHDDLPAMDDDDLRRGRPTLHRAFDEATAILAGDALLTMAFDILASLEADGGIRATLVSMLARASGLGGMAGGQALDLAAERAAFDRDAIARMQAMKTGALFRFAAEAGAVLGGAREEERRRLRDYGALLGHAFQLADDLLDVTASAEAAGKATGKDAGRGKATMVARDGVAASRALLAAVSADAVALVGHFGAEGDILAAAARFTAERKA